MKIWLISITLLLMAIYFMGDVPKCPPITCKNVDGYQTYSDDYRIEHNVYIDNTGKGVLRDCTFYDLKLADQIRRAR